MAARQSERTTALGADKTFDLPPGGVGRALTPARQEGSGERLAPPIAVRRHRDRV